MLPELLKKYFEIALEEKLDFYKVDFGFEDESGSYGIRYWDSKEIKLNRPDGTEAGELGVSSMQYWSVKNVTRKIPRGIKRNFTILELI